MCIRDSIVTQRGTCLPARVRNMQESCGTDVHYQERDLCQCVNLMKEVKVNTAVHHTPVKRRTCDRMEITREELRGNMKTIEWWTTMKFGPSSYGEGGAKSKTLRKGIQSDLPRTRVRQRRVFEKTSPWKQGWRTNEEVARRLARESRSGFRRNVDEKPIRT